MKLTHNLANPTLGELAATFLQFAQAGAPVDAPVEMIRNRSSEVVEISIDTDVAAALPETPEDAAAMLSRVSEGGGEAPAPTPSEDAPAPAPSE